MKVERLLRRCSFPAQTVLILSGCGKEELEAVSVPAWASVMTVVAAEITQHDGLPGRAAGVPIAEIRLQVGGIIQFWLLEQGAKFCSDQLVFQINPAPFMADTDMAAAVRHAESTLGRARVQVGRLDSRIKAGAVSRQLNDDVVLQRDEATTHVMQTLATMHAPIARHIDQAMISGGGLVGSNNNNPLARILQIDQVYVDVCQPVSALEALRQSLATQQTVGESGSEAIPVTILRSNVEPYLQNSRVLFSGVNVDPGADNVLMRILVDNQQRLLLPCMLVRAKVSRGNHANVLMVPQQAVTRVGGKSQEWVIDSKNLANPVSVELGELVGRHYRISSRLEAGHKIVMDRQERFVSYFEVVTHNWHPTDYLTSAL